MSPISRLQELRHFTGSLAKAAESAGLSLKQAGRYINEPGRGALVQENTRRQLAAALEEVSPFPLFIERLKYARKHLLSLEADPGCNSLQEYILSYDGCLDQEPDDDHGRLQFRYMRMMFATSKALYHGGKVNWFNPRSKHLQDAQKDAESAIELADQMLLNDPDNRDVRHLRAIIYVNWTQILLEQVKAKSPNLSGNVMSVTELKTLFRKENALAQLKEVVENFPYLWTAAYNGLEQSSMLEDDRHALWFYHELKRMDSGFQDFDYSPGELLPISEEKGMIYFCLKYRAQLHTPNPIRSSQKRTAKMKKTACAGIVRAVTSLVATGAVSAGLLLATAVIACAGGHV